MDSETEILNRLLRWELTAVNQQFTHVLALRFWGEEETADRIMVVDEVDFPNAMRIADHLVANELPIALPPGAFTPGQTLPGILATEQRFERAFPRAIEGAEALDGSARGLIETASAPRQAYADWLSERVIESAADEGAGADARAVAGLMARLMVVVEQPLLHAFVHWHRGERAHADAAWGASGAAMMLATELVEYFARSGAVPTPDSNMALDVAQGTDEAIALDSALAERCAEEATAAALRCEDTELAALCQRAAAHCRALARWQPGETHPAASGPAPFRDFAVMHRRYVEPSD